MKGTPTAQRYLYTKIKKRLLKVIKTYEKVIGKLSYQLYKLNQLADQQEVTTLRETISLGLDQTKKLLANAQLDYQRIDAKQAESESTIG